MTLKEKFRPLVWFNSGSFNVSQNREKDENSIKCEQIADDYAINFALFLSIQCETNGDKDGWWFYNKKWKTTNEMLEIFKKEKGL